jgi:hypothetical protein
LVGGAAFFAPNRRKKQMSLRERHLEILDGIIRDIPTHRPPREAAGHRGYGELPINQSAAATPDLPERPAPRSLGTPVNVSSPTDDPQPPLGGPNPGPAILRRHA